MTASYLFRWLSSHVIQNKTTRSKVKNSDNDFTMPKESKKTTQSPPAGRVLRQRRIPIAKTPPPNRHLLSVSPISVGERLDEMNTQSGIIYYNKFYYLFYYLSHHFTTYRLIGTCQFTRDRASKHRLLAIQVASMHGCDQSTSTSSLWCLYLH